MKLIFERFKALDSETQAQRAELQNQSRQLTELLQLCRPPKEEMEPEPKPEYEPLCTVCNTRVRTLVTIRSHSKDIDAKTQAGKSVHDKRAKDNVTKAFINTPPSSPVKSAPRLPTPAVSDDGNGSTGQKFPPIVPQLNIKRQAMTGPGNSNESDAVSSASSTASAVSSNRGGVRIGTRRPLSGIGRSTAQNEYSEADGEPAVHSAGDEGSQPRNYHSPRKDQLHLTSYLGEATIAKATNTFAASPARGLPLGRGITPPRLRKSAAPGSRPRPKLPSSSDLKRQLNENEH